MGLLSWVIWEENDEAQIYVRKYQFGTRMFFEHCETVWNKTFLKDALEKSFYDHS